MFLAFATAHVSGLSIAHSLTAVLAFSWRSDTWRTGHALGKCRLAAPAFFLEGVLLFAPAFCGIGYRRALLEHPFQPFALIVLTHAREAHTERRCPKARNPGSDDSGPDTNDHRHQRGLFAREQLQPEIGEKAGRGIFCRPATLLSL